MPYIGKAPSSGIRSRFIYTATAAQTTFTGADGTGKTLGYTDGEYVDVYLNGVLLDPADYTATSKTSVVLDSGATVSDIVEIVVYDTFSVFNGTFTGDLTVDGDTLFVDSTNNRVGIGTTSPQGGTGLHIKTGASGATPNGDLIIEDDANVKILLSCPAANTAQIHFGDDAANNVGKIQYDHSDNSLAFSTDATERMRIDSSGKVAMGTSSADADASVLSIKGTDPAQIYDGQIIIHGSATSGAANTGAGIGFKGHHGTGNRNLGAIQSLKENATSGNADAYMRFITRSNSGGLAEAMRIDSSSNVGIGTTSPTVQLASGNRVLHLDSGTNQGSEIKLEGAGTALMAIGNTSIASYFYNVAQTPIIFATDNTERMRISPSSLALSIGKTTFGTAGQGYTVRGNTAPQCYFNKSQSGAVNGVLFYHSDSYVGGLNYDNTSTSLATSSDERLKDNIENSDDAGAKIDAMQVRQFDWKSTGEHQEYGFVAQELEPVFAHAVHTDKEGDFKSVDYACLVPMLVKEIQSLRQRITDLENA